MDHKKKEHTQKHESLHSSSEEDKRLELISKIGSLFSSKPASKAKPSKNLVDSVDSEGKLAEEKSAGDSKSEDLARQEMLLKFKPYFPYFLLTIIVYLGSKIRWQNLHLLKDSFTGKWIPTALDPYLFYRYAHYIQEHGSLFLHDSGRFIPEGISTVEHLFKTNFMVYLHKLVGIFSGQGLDFTIIIYPVVCFAIALVFFYLLTKEFFDHATAVLATAFLAIVPAFLQRTMAGFSDHEALGIMFFFIALWFFVRAIKSKRSIPKDSSFVSTVVSMKSSLLYYLGAGIATGLMGQSWGGWKFLILIVSGFMLAEFFLGKVRNEDIYGYIIWMLSVIFIVSVWLPLYSLSTLLSSFTTGIAFLTLGVLVVELLVSKTAIRKYLEPLEKHVPHSVLVLAIAVGFGIILLLISGSFADLFSKFGEIWEGLLRPLGKNRWELTVAEQHQPYFTQWMSQFGPRLFGISALPSYLIFFMLGSVFVFRDIVKNLKYKFVLVMSYVVFIIAFTMSRYSSSSMFNGTNQLSIGVYIGSLILFGLFIVGYYLHSFYKDSANFAKISEVSKLSVLLIIWFVLLVVGARGAIRLLFMFAPVTAVLAAHGFLQLWRYSLKIKQAYYKAIAIALLIFVLVSPFAAPMNGIIPTFYQQSSSQASGSGPGYNFQWQQAGEWVKENIPEDAVFAHWWDYGYWVQTGWGRNTVLDGTNKITYWNYLMGRHVMTGQNQQEALEWLKVHDASHFLIVSDEIGKYTAYSSIGSDENYDRYSYITTFLFDESMMRETRDGFQVAYTGGYTLDSDLIYDGKLYPSGQAGIGAIVVPMQGSTQDGLSGVSMQQPFAIVVSNGQQTEIPVECLSVNGEITWFEEKGLGGCAVLLPALSSNGVENDIGAALYISDKGVNALWANLYIFDGNNPRYDTSAFVKSYDQSASWAPLSYYVDHNRIIGPIKIWEIQYPEGFTVDPELEQLYLGHNENLPDFFYDVS